MKKSRQCEIQSEACPPLQYVQLQLTASLLGVTFPHTHPQINFFILSPGSDHLRRCSKLSPRIFRESSPVRFWLEHSNIGPLGYAMTTTWGDKFAWTQPRVFWNDCAFPPIAGSFSTDYQLRKGDFLWQINQPQTPGPAAKPRVSRPRAVL